MQSDPIRYRIRATCLDAARNFAMHCPRESNETLGKCLETLGRILRGLDSDSWGVDGLHTFAKQAGLQAIAPDLARLFVALKREESEKDKALGIDKYTPAEHVRAMDALLSNMENHS